MEVVDEARPCRTARHAALRQAIGSNAVQPACARATVAAFARAFGKAEVAVALLQRLLLHLLKRRNGVKRSARAERREVDSCSYSCVRGLGGKVAGAARAGGGAAGGPSAKNLPRSLSDTGRLAAWVGGGRTAELDEPPVMSRRHRWHGWQISY